MNETEFTRLAAAGYNRIPVMLTAPADLDTPLSLYLKLADAPYTYLLESVQGGERFGRYSFIGLAARTRIEVRGELIRVFEDGEIVHEDDSTSPLDFISNYMAQFKVPDLPALPRSCGGLVGSFGYDTVRYVEKKLQGKAKTDTLGTPDISLLLSDEIVVVDNLAGTLTLVIYADATRPDAWAEAQMRLRNLVGELHKPLCVPVDVRAPSAPPVSEFGEAEFKAAVRRAKQYIIDGDIMQVVLSQRMSRPYSASPLALYRALRSLNPSPYMFFFNFDDYHVVGASPEILVRLQDDTVTVRPIAGTRPRGKDAAADLAYEQDLLADPKERAEHLMLLDLGRNDVGRVAATGTVGVTEQFIIERYSHVMHIVSNVEGKLKPGADAMAVLKASFPAGTVSGAPKVRAMEIIDELEPSKRGIYAGSVGYLGFNGDMDVAIAIRTAVIKDGYIHVQAGAGIVADSDPDAEWTETQNKAKAALRAAELAEMRGDLLCY
ncbi:MAG TPA: anthranilate synthase component I [Rhodocyclaceae bacterium]|nr:anthranilate synthase component I [Rhodocyclaceae bacterium]